MSDTRERTLIKRDRCPYCHDDIVPGGDNYACHECLAWHHTGCWKEYGACVGCGNTWVKDATSGMMSSPMPKEAGPKEEPPCNHQFSTQDYACIYCKADAGDVYDETYVESLIDKGVDEDYDNETSCCESTRCQEPTTRIERFCTLCISESEIWSDTLAGKSQAERKREYEDYIKQKRRSKGRWDMLIIISFITAIAAWLIYFIATSVVGPLTR